MRTLGIVIVLVLAALATVWHLEERDAPDASQRVRLSTTTSTANSGLLEWLREVFEPQSGLEVQVVAVGTGEAIERAKRGDADLVLVHAREREDEFVESGHGVDRRDVMWNDFVILGPPEDPAGIRGVADPAAAMVQVLERGATFVSRGDDSGTHIREKALWKRSGLDPMTREETYLRAGAGMGKCLEMADQKRAYLLADRGTYAAFKARLDLAVLVEGHESLRNPYGIILVNPQRHAHVNAEGARRFHEWVTSPEGQARIGAFEVDGEVLFHPVTRE